MNKKEQKMMLNLSTELETDRLIIRKYEKDDGKVLFDLLERNNNREFLKDHVDEATNVLTLKDAEIRVSILSDWWASRTRFVMGIWLKETNEYIGNIWIEPKKWEVPSFELGYYLDYGYTGKGLATEAVKRSMKFIIEELNAHKIILITRDTNERSIKLAERLAFIKEGHHKESNIENGKRFGLFYYRLLRKEYYEIYNKNR
ncbi:MAG: GNAT family N-acetyltransferase [Asgard group archaeon]|nr:GNAT family N-acetyltransferase [Asgard group archaeon]